MKEESRREHNPVSGSTDGAVQKAGLLAPLEERSNNHSKSSSDGGVDELNTAELKLPVELTEEDEKRFRILGLEPVAFVILVFALGFIAYITYLISVDQPDTKSETNTTIESQR